MLLADVTDRQEQIDTLLQKISKDLVAKGAQKGAQTIGDVSFVTFVLPKKKVTDRQVTVYYATHQGQLLATDDAEVAKQIVGRFQGDHKDSPKHLASFAMTQKRAAEG